MAKAVEVTVRVADLLEFQGFVVAAGNVLRAYDAIRDDGAGTALGVAVEGMRAAMRDLAPSST
jgi:hypothetical protein